MQTYAITQYHIQTNKLRLPPDKALKPHQINILKTFFALLHKLFKNKTKTTNKFPLFRHSSSKKVKPLLLNYYERPEFMALRHPKARNTEFYLTKTKFRSKFTRIAKRCFKGSLQIEFLHDKNRPTYQNINKLPLETLTKINFTFVRRHSMVDPILEREFNHIIYDLHKTTKLKELKLDFTGGFDFSKPNHTTTYLFILIPYVLPQLKALESLTLYFRRSSGILFSPQAFHQLFHSISYMKQLRSLGLDIEVNLRGNMFAIDQNIISRTLKELKKLQILKLFLHNLALHPNYYCELWEGAISRLVYLEFVYVSLPIRDPQCFNSYRKTLLSLPHLKKLYLTSNELISAGPACFCEFMQSLKAKKVTNVIFNLYDMNWFKSFEMQSVKDLLVANRISHFDLHCTMLLMDYEILGSIATKFESNKDLKSFGLSLTLCQKTNIDKIATLMQGLSYTSRSLREVDISLPSLGRYTDISTIFSKISPLRRLKELKIDLTGFQKRDTYWLKDLKNVLNGLKELRVLEMDFSKMGFTQNYMGLLGEILEVLGRVTKFTIELEKEDLEVKDGEGRADDEYLDLFIGKLGSLTNVNDLCLNLKGWEKDLSYNSVLLIRTLQGLKHLKKLNIFVCFIFNWKMLSKFTALVEKTLPKISLFLTEKY